MSLIKKSIDKIYLLDTTQIRKYGAIYIGVFSLLIASMQFLFILKNRSLSDKKKKILDTYSVINKITKKKYSIEIVKHKIDSLLKK